MKNKLLCLLLILVVGVLSGCGDKVEMSLNKSIDTIPLNSTYKEPGATATVGDKKLNVTVTGSVDTSKLGVYEIVYSVKYEKKEYTIKRYVYVYDNIKPVLTLNPGIDTINVGEKWVDAGVSVVDDSSYECEVIGTVDCNNEGTYTITYQVTDSYSNKATIQRIVNVVI